MKNDEIISAVKLLRPKTGEMLVFTSTTAGSMSRAEYEIIQEMVREKVIPDGVTAVVLGPGQSIDHVSREELERWGIVRRESVDELNSTSAV